MSHAFYIYAAWGVSAVVLIGVVAAIWLESTRLQRQLKHLEAQGIRRRSAGDAS